MPSSENSNPKEQKLLDMSFDRVYPLYVQKVVRKGRTEAELLSVIGWLTGYTAEKVIELTKSTLTFSEFFNNARIHPSAGQIKGTICGVRIESIEHPTARLVRILDKLVDELAKGKPLEKIINR
ncbi:MAG: DUF2200 family protein [Thermaurantimonas sp.]|uniref:DUF2200 family protein n=1 Tax=Thermaurantimonas sp. TaxID=2681568 RepID=UPI00391DADF6